jgi:hypothetical protein
MDPSGFEPTLFCEIIIAFWLRFMVSFAKLVSFSGKRYRFNRILNFNLRFSLQFLDLNLL